jgi:DNA primase
MMSPQCRFDKSLLPDARLFFEREIGRLSRPDRKGWALGNCPFHSSKSKRSLSVHRDGAFHCFGCGAKGGDLIAFIRLRDRVSFKEACQQLGCWRETSPDDLAKVRRLERDKEAKRQAESQRQQQEKLERIKVRDALHTLEAFRDQKSRQLDQLEAETPGVETQDKEFLWQMLSLLETQIVEAEREYRVMAALDPVEVA